ncbi:hypothetical protein BDN70DRAFT_917820 [Pholiota conissans]|uniref:F-box domain-containing protein n=1 Tax=Pholiota conissans TaxID=109636 RepID=A0A9P5ZBT6_9AGAR|nr:hypothetical protein BDN70DRAFT_917820 [Pholiota conissans]
MLFRKPAAIERLPAETLVGIFNYLSWREIIAHHIKSKSASTMHTALQHLRGQYLVRSSVASSPCIEVCNWSQSDPLLQIKSYIFYSGSPPTHMVLLPNLKLVIVWYHRLNVYDITHLHSSPFDKIDRECSLRPYWTRFGANSVANVDVSKPYHDLNVTRISIGTRTGIFGLTIPCTNDSEPTYEKISDLELSPVRHSFSGINKIYSHNGSGAANFATYTWPDDCNDKAGSLSTPAASEWREWKSKHRWSTLPYLDERSNRVIALTRKCMTCHTRVLVPTLPKATGYSTINHSMPWPVRCRTGGDCILFQLLYLLRLDAAIG